jgi:hypothetical protein
MAKKTIIFTIGYFVYITAAAYILLSLPVFTGGEDFSIVAFTVLFCLLTVLSILPFGLYAVVLIRERRLEGQVWVGGKTASAQILDVTPGQPLADGKMLNVTLHLQVQPYDIPAFEGRVDVPVMVSLLPHAGQVITVRYGPVFHRRLILEKPLEELLAPPGDAAQLAAEGIFHPPAAPGLAEKLAGLGDLRRTGALSSAEYEAGMKKMNRPA